MSFDLNHSQSRARDAWPRLIRTLTTHRGRSLDRAICRDIGIGFDFDRVMLLTVDQAQRVLVPRAAWRVGLPGSVRAALATLLRTPLDPGPDGTLSVTSACAVRQQQIFVPDATNPSLDEGIAQRAAVVRVLGTTGYVVTPIVHGGLTLGVLAVDRIDRPILEADRAALRDMAALLALRFAARPNANISPVDTKRDNEAEDVLDALDEGVLLVEHDDTICYSNPAAARRLGIQRLDLIGQTLDEVLQNGAPELRRAIANLRDVDQYDRPSRNGTEWNADAGVRRVLLGGGRRALILSPRRGPSGFREGRDLCMLVHDLKAPMQSVLGFAELLQLGRAGPLQPDQRVFVEHIVQNGETLLALIARVLEVRSPAGSPDAELLEVGPVIRDVSNCMAGKAYTANVAIDVDVQTDAPPVSIDVIEFREVVQNLLDNAIQAAPAGTRILLRALQCGSSLCVEVTPAEPGRVGIRHAQSFDLLRHAPEADHRRRTPHLGLHIVRDIAERNNGELWAEPATNGGLAFKFILPAGPAGRAAGCA